jgi:undecaprenyl-diphosphatase
MNLWLFNLIYSLNKITLFSSGLSLFLGEYLIYLLGVGIVLYISLAKENKKKKIKWLIIFLLAGLFSNLIVTPLIHLLYQSPRPFVSLIEIDNYKYFLRVTDYSTSFPSGHTSLAFAIAIILFLKNKKTGALALITALFIGLGRILMGVHWPFDVLGGIGVGILCALASYRIVSKIVIKNNP